MQTLLHPQLTLLTGGVRSPQGLQCIAQDVAKVLTLTLVQCISPGDWSGASNRGPSHSSYSEMGPVSPV